MAIEKSAPLALKTGQFVSALKPAAQLASLIKAPKKEGDISSLFASLSGAAPAELPERFATLKCQLIKGNEERLLASWQRLLEQLSIENELVAQLGPAVVPQIDFADLETDSEEFVREVRRKGVAVIRGVVPEAEARGYKTDVEAYVQANPGTKAFPSHDPQVYELYWSPSQIRARSHPNMLTVQRFLMGLWDSKDKNALITTSHPLAYADRVRIRKPGDASFALGPHVDSGSVERWESEGYGLGGVYEKIWQGKWDEYDPWEASSRVSVNSDLYEGSGACTMFRMFQGWLSMSHTGPHEGTLMVNPLLRLTTAYFLLRPFFSPIKQPECFGTGEFAATEFLQPSNWRLISEADMTSELQGARMGGSQELNQVLHPHLDLKRTMVHMPKIKPGDYVVWHCDTIHAVDKVHMGTTDSSVLYIPVCPATVPNAEYLVRQRETFLGGVPGPDFPGGRGESQHVGRPNLSYLVQHSNNAGLQAMGFEKLDGGDENETVGEIDAVRKINEILGFR